MKNEQLPDMGRTVILVGLGITGLLALAFGQVTTDSVNRQADFRSPGRAVLLSLLVPGGGQLYTGRYWKAALIAPAELGLGYLTIQEHRWAVQALSRADTVRYQYHQDRRNTFLWWTAATVVFSMADAYVSAQMFGFDRELQLDLQPDRFGVRLALK